MEFEEKNKERLADKFVVLPQEGDNVEKTVTTQILFEDKKNIEFKLLQSRKMEALGTLAGGIAHDFNNLLMGIQGNASLMLLSMDSSHPHYEKLKRIEEQVKNGAELTRQLMGFARGGKYDVRPADLNELVKKTAISFGHNKDEIKILRRYQRDIWTVEVDHGQIEQVMLSLYDNAWQAMPGGGTLYLETENVVLDKNYCKLFNVKPGNYVKFSVTDTGIGMDEATRQKIFEPFFTTKKMGRGKGLGLASVYGIIKNHGGLLHVYSEKGHGTTFNSYLPVSENVISAEDALADDDVIRGNQTILLVDDEKMIIEVGVEILESLGYKVLSANGGKEAIEIIRRAYMAKSKEQKGKVRTINSIPDLVILDLMMPDMGGGETYDKIKEIDPNIQVLLSSGYSINGQATEILKRGCNGFIQKPFGITAISQKIREILDSTQPAT